ncbi:MAG: imidazolonepropionase [Candidatus Heimdallarchaeota archaeon]|nr:imidazolonepropionase [Candidatus Heimdallarchaeota archaeon]
MEITGLSGYFDGYQWHDGPFRFIIKNNKIASIEQDEGSNGDLHIPGHMASIPFSDGHTHLIFSGDRSFELSMKIQGKSYAEILESGGGILNTVKSTRASDDETLLELVLNRLDLMLQHGTLTVEAKSGYGLTAEQELRLLRILNQANDIHPIEIIPTYCGAHALTGETSREDFVEEVISIIPEIKSKALATSTDVFCDRGAFTVSETVEILNASKDVGLPIRVHAEELEYTGIGKIAAKDYGALSVDHLLLSTKSDFEIYAESQTTAMFMPAATIGLFTTDRPQGWRDLDLNIGLGSDFNPNNLVISMQTALRLAVFLYRMTPFQAMKAATTGAFKGIMGEQQSAMTVNSKADLVIFEANTIDELTTRFDQNLARIIIKNGEIIHSVSRND